MSKTEWKECKLSELLTIKYGKNQKAVEDPNGRIPIYGTGGLMGFASRPLYDKPSILIGRKGSIEKVRYVDHPFWTVDTLFYSEINKEIVLPKFLYYSMSLTNFSNYNEGTTIPSLRTETLNRLIYRIPSFKIQEKIVQILSSLDDKIELNNAINRNLEEQAKAIFKNWFVDFAPFGGEMPDDWTTASLSDIADYLNGLAMQKFRPKENEVGLPVLKIKELRQGFPGDDAEQCSPSIKSEYIVNDGDVIFSWSGSLLVDLWCGGTCGLNQHLFKVTSQKFGKWFYYLWTKHHLDRFVFLAADKATTMGHIKREELDKAEVCIPSKSDYDKIGSSLKPIIETIIAKKVENRHLITLRDELLPKLMSNMQ